MIIERIRREHGYMVRLLAILNGKLEQLKNEKPINYSLIKEITDYLADHSQAVHHPKEDILYLHYAKHYGQQQQIDDLEQEHEALSEVTEAFQNTVEMILHDAVIPLDMFADQLEDFISRQKNHLELEEREVLPQIAKTFTAEDWRVVENQWLHDDEDPVFGDTIADQYRQLAARVRQTKYEAI
ncbi:putative Hemerythrin [Vibrio nigripulchritudo MADA3029]|uniref:Putative Hemerythrin n=1 Tax=Vibrio nigripulchritudo TaxID=28173 RepID=U4K8T2_9VIBR|nr:hemerythrin domain-containing protein [Vibrio nigripulchritudo]CCN45398.1 putative Hemerythrin [Vibrio nigripulchritudo MADA3020]CCN53719.1 putative Hemerythrin [Vibrio nigripulchritudo MADA3021]CCN58607.1 putative Hemerythrin [Vibrio nigripulchritudo MADA3029]CCN80509.1 putative Hemerythrin [Vibrio nigripulchritudo BLFn1]CCN88239.1 putative Hemerythrin [Vibrio nigripulchritudo SFn27]